MFQYNQESAMKAGGVVRESGAYLGKITEAVYGASEQKGTQYLELTFEAQDGGEFKYLTLYYRKQDGTEVKGGASMINAIMGITGLNNLSMQQVAGTPYSIAPELVGKPIGLILQKVLYTKNNPERSDGYKFEIRLPFDSVSRQTLKEKIEGKNPEMVNKIVSTLKDKDDRTNGAPNSSNGNSQPVSQDAANMGFGG